MRPDPRTSDDMCAASKHPIFVSVSGDAVPQYTNWYRVVSDLMLDRFRYELAAAVQETQQ